MTDTREGKLLNLINASGFLYQLGIETLIRSTEADHGYRIIAREHPWRNPESNAEGFIDLIIEHGAACLVIECKRSQDGVWAPLVSDPEQGRQHRVLCLWTHGMGEKANHLAGCNEFNVLPPTEEANFCIVRGTGEGEISLIERLATRLLESVDALADEELKLSRLFHMPRVYIPIILTNAIIEVAYVDPTKVSMETGRLDQAKFERRDFVRFRKTFATPRADLGDCRELADVDSRMERTVILMNSQYLAKTLKGFQFAKLNWHERYPWQIEMEKRIDPPESSI